MGGGSKEGGGGRGGHWNIGVGDPTNGSVGFQIRVSGEWRFVLFCWQAKCVAVETRDWNCCNKKQRLGEILAVSDGGTGRENSRAIAGLQTSRRMTVVFW